MRSGIDGSHVTASAGTEDEGSHDQQRRIDPSHTLTTIDPWSRIIFHLSDLVAPLIGSPAPHYLSLEYSAMF